MVVWESGYNNWCTKAAFCWRAEEGVGVERVGKAA